MARGRTRNLRPVPDVESRLEYRTVHGYRRAFRTAGSGEHTVLLIHGIGDSSQTWDELIPHLAQRYTVIAPDLLGHGRSDKPRADYSVAAYANGMRDLLTVLGVEKVTLVGHSLGGGVAMQFAYQFPQLVDRLIMVSNGGVTKDVNPMLRLVSLPVVNHALRLLQIPGAMLALELAGGLVNSLAGYPLLHDTRDFIRVVSGLPDPTAREAFVRTLRAVVDWRGQVVTMLDRCYLTEGVPVQIIWGDLDSVIPVAHAYLAHAAMPGSKLEIFRGAGHFPYHDDAMRFLDVVEDFMESTPPGSYDHSDWRRMLIDGVGEATITGPSSTRMAVLGAMGADERSAT